jgi:hypothetical protein
MTYTLAELIKNKFVVTYPKPVEVNAGLIVCETKLNNFLLYNVNPEPTKNRWLSVDSLEENDDLWNDLPIVSPQDAKNYPSELVYLVNLGEWGVGVANGGEVYLWDPLYCTLEHIPGIKEKEEVSETSTGHDDYDLLESSDFADSDDYDFGNDSMEIIKEKDINTEVIKKLLEKANEKIKEKKEEIKQKKLKTSGFDFSKIIDKFTGREIHKKKYNNVLNELVENHLNKIMDKVLDELTDSCIPYEPVSTIEVIPAPVIQQTVVTETPGIKDTNMIDDSKTEYKYTPNT